MQLWSDAFEDGQQIPVRYTKDGDNVSPALRWNDLPEGTRSLALFFENTTPQTKEPFLHWMLYEIPPETDGLPEGFDVGYDGPLARSAVPCDFASGYARWISRSIFRPGPTRKR